jgi:hypothetical protein
MTVAWIELEHIHDAVADIPCPRCEAPVGAKCTNPVTGHTARIPCIARIRALDEGAA